MKSFRDTEAPLSGQNLIEASAGTGKTYAIATLCVRLVVEKGLAVSELLVVTYTVAATAELRGRIRTRLSEALGAVVNGASEDKGLAALLVAWTRSGALPRAAVRLERAVRDFDRAAIFTIHGFCQRVLRDSAFESGASFDAEFLTEQGPLLEEITLDYWTTRTSGAPAAFIRHLLEDKPALEPDALRALVSKATASPSAVILPPRPTAAPLSQARWDAIASELAALWRAHRAEVIALLCAGTALSKRSYDPDKIASTWVPLLDLLATDAAAAAGQPAVADVLGKLATSELKGKTNKGKITPHHAFFEACERSCALREDLATAKLGFTLDAMAFGRDELTARKQALDVLSFDDLLVRLRDALVAPGGDRLARTIREAYPAALIDEFQDTDKVQYQIFERVYQDERADADDEATGSSVLFLIGDPKQAIYGFRGADVFAYMHARANSAAAQYTLDTNWRSQPELIAAINTLFSRGDSPFLFEEIAYQEVRAPDAAGGKRARKGRGRAPLRLAVVRPKEEASDRTQLTAPIQKRAAIDFVVSDMVALLQGDTTLDGEPVRPRDFAVLCRTNSEIAEVQAALRGANVPSVVEGDASVFEAQEAGELARILAAFLSPNDPRAVKAALATSLFGWTADELYALGGDEDRWDEWCGRFREWHRTWSERGFIQALREWMGAAVFTAVCAGLAPEAQPAEPVRLDQRLLRLSDGERRLTNVYHLGELLQARAVSSHLGPQALLRWLRAMIDDKAARIDAVGDSSVMRLESDDDAVKLVTIHKSKGLEYPLVYCPFLWAGQLRHKSDDGIYRYHDPDAGDALTLQLAERAPSKLSGRKKSEPEHPDHRAVLLAEREALAENLRLLYVAVTRAKYGCTIVCGQTRDSDKTALAYLLYRPDEIDTSPEGVAACFKAIAALTDEAQRATLAALAASAKGCIAIEEHEVGCPPIFVGRREGKKRLRARSAKRTPRANGRIASFTSLAAGRRGAQASGPARWAADDDSAAVDRDGAAATLPRFGAQDGRGAPLTQAGHKEVTVWESADLFSAKVKRVPVESSATGLILEDFPRGVRAGLFFHQVLEKADFTDVESAALRELVAAELARSGFEAARCDQVCRALAAFVKTPLAAAPHDLSLSQVSTAERLNELDFLFPVDGAGTGLTAPRLAAILREPHAPGWMRGYADAVADLGFSTLRGYLRGFADLVFVHEGRWYLVDYKSNHLGPYAADYAQPALLEAMQHHHYILQYLIYTVALDRYLRLRVPGYDYSTHFGGAAYLFLRGMDPSFPTGNGVFFDRPSPALVAALSALLSSAATDGGGRR